MQQLSLMMFMQQMAFIYPFIHSFSSSVFCFFPHNLEGGRVIQSLLTAETVRQTVIHSLPPSLSFLFPSLLSFPSLHLLSIAIRLYVRVSERLCVFPFIDSTGWLTDWLAGWLAARLHNSLITPPRLPWDGQSLIAPSQPLGTSVGCAAPIRSSRIYSQQGISYPFPQW